MTQKYFVRPSFFCEKEKVILETNHQKASSFIFNSGVQAIRLTNSLGELVILPYQGMQIWSALFMGRNLAMISMFEEPNPTRSYLETYGGFLLHCGFTAMGVPTDKDTHPLHGELPNAPYTNVYLEIGEDQKGSFLSIGGTYNHTVAFNHNYLAVPEIKLYDDSSVFTVNFTATNLKNTGMEYMYLAHINFRPVNGASLSYSAKVSPETVRVRTSIPSHVHPGPDYRGFINELSTHPEKHHKISPELSFDPEVVFFINYLSDKNGWAHTMQINPDGTADYVRHNPSILNHGIRWISRTPDQDAMGMILPATAEPEGYTVEKQKGNLKYLQAKQTFSCEMEMGVLKHSEAEKTFTHIYNMINSAGG